MWLTVELPDGVLVEIGDLVGLPDDRDAWVARALADPRPPGGTVRRTATTVRRHAAGWPVTILTAIVTAADGSEIEHRVVLFYELLVLGALVRCRGRLEDPALAALLAAPIRLHGSEPVAIAELFD